MLVVPAFLHMAVVCVVDLGLADRHDACSDLQRLHPAAVIADQHWIDSAVQCVGTQCTLDCNDM
jgi:hypothetical protein